MTKNKKLTLFLLGSVSFAIIILLIVNESYYEDYKQNIRFYGSDIVRVIGNGSDRDHYSEYIKRELTESGLKDVVVEISGENLYGAKNSIFIEATPPPTKLDSLLHRKIKPIQIKYDFINPIHYFSTSPPV